METTIKTQNRGDTFELCAHLQMVLIPNRGKEITTNLVDVTLVIVTMAQNNRNCFV